MTKGRFVRKVVLGALLAFAVTLLPHTPTLSAQTAQATAPTNDPTGATTGTAKDVTVKDAANPTLPEVMETVGHNKVAINIVWTLLAGFLVMFMQAGFALVETGFTRAKNVSHTMGMNFMVYAIGMLGFWICGFAIQMGGLGAMATLGGTSVMNHELTITLFGKSFGLMGLKGFFLSGDSYDVAVFAMFLFQMVFMDTAATIPTGAMAERWKFSAFVIFAFFMSMVVYPLYANWVWGGGLAVATRRELRSRARTRGLRRIVRRAHGGGRGRARRSYGHRAAHRQVRQAGQSSGDSRSSHPHGHHRAHSSSPSDGSASTPGRRWRAAICESGSIATNTMLAGAAGAFTAMLYMWCDIGKPDPSMIGQRIAGRPRRHHGAMRVREQRLGGDHRRIAGVLVVASVFFVERTLKVDDPVGAVSVHGVCGAWGVLVSRTVRRRRLRRWAERRVGNGVRGLFYGDATPVHGAEVGTVTCFVSFSARFTASSSWSTRRRQPRLCGGGARGTRRARDGRARLSRFRSDTGTTWGPGGLGGVAQGRDGDAAGRRNSLSTAEGRPVRFGRARMQEAV